MVQILLGSLADEVLQKTLEDVVLGHGGVIGLLELQAVSNILVKFFAELSLLVFKDRIPVVFDRVIGTTMNNVRDLSPSILRASLQNEEDPTFFDAPLALLQERIQLVVPSLTALLAGPVGDGVSNDLPLAGANFRYKFD